MINKLESSPRVTVIGAGLMGHGIAQAFMSAGAPTTVWDPSESTLRTASKRIEEHLKLLGENPEVTISLAPTLRDSLDNAELIVEAIPESLAMKRELLQEVDLVNHDAIFATNTSVLRITEISSASAQPQRVVGTHWWNPPYLIPLVEVVRGEHTDNHTVRQTMLWLSSIGKHPVEIRKDAPGFVGNRMQFALVREAAHIVAEGIASPETVDAVVKETMARRWSAIGPLRNSDYIGLDLVTSIMSYLAPTLATDQNTPKVIQEHVRREELGAKSGQGIYHWDQGDREKLEDTLIQHLLHFRESNQSERDQDNNA